MNARPDLNFLCDPNFLPVLASFSVWKQKSWFTAAFLAAFGLTEDARRATSRRCRAPWLFVRTLWLVRITFDPAKNERNVRLRGLSFEQAADFAFDAALFDVDERKEYHETRFVAIGLLGDRVHVLCFTETPDGVRVISFRKANSREVNRYAQARSAD